MLDIKFEPSGETLDKLQLLEGEELNGFFSWRIVNRTEQLD